MSDKKLYFVALLPPEEIRKEVKSLKEEMMKKYAAKHALKLPAHITLQPPFRLSEAREKELTAALDKTAREQDTFLVELRDFGAFPPRVIFIEIANPGPIDSLFRNLIAQLQELVPVEEEKSLHPHITIATRDLDKKQFRRAWNDFRQRSFRSSFRAAGLVLFKHNGKTWDLLQQFSFS